MEQTVTIIDIGPTSQGLQSIIVEKGKNRLGVKFLLRQALKRAYRCASKVTAYPFKMK